MFPATSKLPLAVTLPERYKLPALLILRRSVLVVWKTMFPPAEGAFIVCVSPLYVVVDDVNLNALSLLLSSPPILKYSPVAPAATFKYPLVISTFPLASIVNSGVPAPNVVVSFTLIAKLLFVPPDIKIGNLLNFLYIY